MALISSKSVITAKKENKSDHPLSLETDVRLHYRRVFNSILHNIKKYIPNPDLPLLRRAYNFSYRAHRDQLRLSGVPYIDHCLETVRILVDLRMDITTIVAGLLHDVVEDTGISIEEVSEKFGEEVGQLVDGVTKISELKFQSQEEQQAENFRKMIFSMAKDLRVIIIKLSDRLHNMRTLEHLPKKKAYRIALETKEVYAPLAHRFGIARIKWELDDLAFKALEPAEYTSIARQINERREAREAYIRRVVEPIQNALDKHGVEAKVMGRAKTLSSIHKKMVNRDKPIEEIYDILAIRVIVSKVDDCYYALGILHTLFTPVQERFKDYIATPKSNMYQSLHTTVIGPEGRMVEIQVRTEEMHRIAEIGIAAHWKYKEQKIKEDELDRYSAWVREMIDWHQEQLNPEEYLDFLKTDLFTNEVFVFTPRGDLLKLPAGSTPVDFAFAVHTDIGMQCIGAKINGRIVGLNYKLHNGDSVEIITSQSQRPSRDWLTFVRTSKAKSKIKHWIKETLSQEAEKLGEEILSRELKKYHVRLNKTKLEEIAKEWKGLSLERLYVALGHGEISFQRLLEKIDPDKFSVEKTGKQKSLIDRFVTRARSSARGVRVQGEDNLVIGFANCCHPVPGDPIIGYISKGRGIVVHRRDCRNALALLSNQERMIDVSWDLAGNHHYLVQLKILSDIRKDFLMNVGEIISSLDANIIKAEMNTENGIITSFLIIEVKDLTHLTRIIRRLLNNKGVLSVERQEKAT